jgi:hypothetical protein
MPETFIPRRTLAPSANESEPIIPYDPSNPNLLYPHSPVAPTGTKTERPDPLLVVANRAIKNWRTG